MNFSTKLFLILALFMLGTASLWARQGSGQINGVVTDAITGEALIGSNVTLKGTSLGTSSGIDGKYALVSVPPGTYTLVARYIGYLGQEIPIEVKAGEKIEQNFSLTAQAIQGQEVIVTAQAKGQQAAINQQLTSNTIINVVSAERIHQLPDADAATALSRLPGVTLMNGDQVVIRGVQAKLNQVLINGIELPSTDMSMTSTTSTRATDLGFISSNLLSGIEVIKALTPDMDANTLGGVVNLRLREAPSGYHFDALAQGNYNSTDQASDNYKFWGSLSSRFFNDKLGIFLQGNMDRTDGGNQIASINPVQVGTGYYAYGQATYQTSSASFQYAANIVRNSGGSLILDYQLPNGKLVLQNTYAGNVTNQLNNYIVLSFDQSRALFTPDRSNFGKDIWINALQFNNNFGVVKVDASVSHSFTQQYTIFGYAPGINGGGWNQFYNPGATAPYGRDASGQAINYNNQEQSITLTKALGILDNLEPTDATDATIQGWPSSIWRQFYQHLYNTSLDVSVPVNFSREITATFKAGGKYIRTTRLNNIDEDYAHGAQDLYLNPDANAYLGVGPAHPVSFSMLMDRSFSRGKTFLSSLYDFKNGGFSNYTLNRGTYDTWMQLSEKGWLIPQQRADSYKDDWTGAEQFSAGYLMGTFNIGPRLTLLGGARFESYNMIYHAQFSYVIHTVYGDVVSTRDGAVGDTVNPVSVYHNVPYNTYNVDRTDNNVFPNVQLQYRMNDWSDLRVAYTTGISRPDYTAIIPKVAFYDPAFELGNPRLKPATAKNFDIVVSLHSNTIGLLTINGFYKEIANQVYSSQVYYASRAQYESSAYIPDSTFLVQRFGFTPPAAERVNLNLNNPNLGYLRGVEIDWQTNFWYLPRPLNAVVLDVNYTHSGSNTEYTVFNLNQGQITDPVTGHLSTYFFTTDTVYGGRLIQQANDVVNVALGIDYKGFSGRISFSMTGNVLNFAGSRPEESSYTGNIYRWDFTLKQDLPIKGLSLSLNGVNIFHNGIETYRNYKMSPNAPVTKNLVSVLYSPTVFELNLRYTL
jgi:TonB-dependent receptor